ncbi:MAG: class I SAM-dependent methyltransferase [Planctomycetes bacterium]|nr:class I SAM-dependent methyltransferase [Planctomycetota bacterium]
MTEGYFTEIAGTYAAHRPGYPAAAVDALLAGLEPSARVIDVGCGTGILTRLLAGAGCHVIGIDPNEEMLGRARAAAGAGGGSATYRVGSAEATGLDDASADLVTCAQAFHWFDAPRALGEFRRLLVEGGRLALIWNVRRGGPFAEAFGRITRRAQEDAASRGLVVHRIRSARPETLGGFDRVRTHVFENPHALDWPGLLGRADSASYFPRSGPVREELVTALRRAFDEHAADGRVILEQKTEVTLAERA